jgi:CheY-like chemotaxis protein
VVKDNKTNQFVMKKILQNIGCYFEIAENEREAIETLERPSST